MPLDRFLLGIQVLRAVRADAVTESCLAVGAYVLLEPIPVAPVVAHLLAPGADGQEAVQRLHVCQGRAKLGYEVLALGLQRFPLADVATDEPQSPRLPLLVEDEGALDLGRELRPVVVPEDGFDDVLRPGPLVGQAGFQARCHEILGELRHPAEFPWREQVADSQLAQLLVGAIAEDDPGQAVDPGDRPGHEVDLDKGDGEVLDQFIELPLEPRDLPLSVPRRGVGIHVKGVLPVACSRTDHRRFGPFHERRSGCGPYRAPSCFDRMPGVPIPFAFMSFFATLLERKPGQALVRERLVAPVQSFMHTETAGGIVIVVAAIIALIWANSPWDEAYFDLWHAELGFDANLFHVEHHLGDWVNDGLMVIFFFVVGLEIKRELVHGELASPRRAALPVIAALGGMTVPALIFVAFNAGGEGQDGWAIPVATDIAFAVGVLALLGPRVPFSLRVFLLALAIADDLGGILIIAAFYTEQISVEALMWAGVVLFLILFARSWGIRTFNVYVFLGVLLWVAVLESGIHATIAGVILAMLTPAGPYYKNEDFDRSAPGLIERWRGAVSRSDHDQQQNILSALEDVTRHTESPLDRLERQLHPWVSYIIVPIFALANAGVVVTGESVSDAAGSAVTWGVALGLFVGKPIGIFLATWLAERSGVASRPAGVTWNQVLGAGLLGGVGFTVSLFITTLSFDSPVLTDDAKMGILLGSITAAIVGYVYLRLLTSRSHPVQAVAQAGSSHH